MKRPLLDDLLRQLEHDYASALEREIKAAAETRLGHAVDWQELGRRAVTALAGPGEYEVLLDERPLLRIRHTSGVVRSEEAPEVTLAVSALRVAPCQ